MIPISISCLHALMKKVHTEIFPETINSYAAVALLFVEHLGVCLGFFKGGFHRQDQEGYGEL